MTDLSINPCNGDSAWLSSQRRDDSWEVAVGGELDLACWDALRDEFARAAGASCDRIVVDASAVTFLDCGGLRAILAAAEGWTGEVWLRSPSPSVRRFAQLAGLEQHWPGLASEDEVRLA